MHEGKIAKLRAYYDSATMMRQPGGCRRREAASRRP
jgi:hypothetical protein